MSVFCITSSKGGVGKSTTSATIACFLADIVGERVLILDLDPNKTLARWRAKRAYPRVDIQACTSEQFAEAFDTAQKSGKYDHTIIDLAGYMHMDILKAFARADVVIIPANKSEPDILEAERTAQYVQKVVNEIGREIPYRILYTRVPPLPTRVSAWAEELSHRKKLPVLETPMLERTAYKSLFVEARAAHEIDPKARNEVRDLIQELVDVIDAARAQRKRGAA